MSDNPQTTTNPPAPPPPEFHSPPPPPGDPPLTAQPTEPSSQAASQPTVEPGQYAPPPGPPPAAAAPIASSTTAAPAPPITDPFADDHQATAATQLQEPPQHPDGPLRTGSVTETPLHSEPAPILPPRPQPQPVLEQTPPPPRASFDQIPDHPATRQLSLGRAQSPPQSVQRVSMTPVQPQPIAPPPQAPVLDANVGNLESDPAIASLHAMFPAFDLLVIQSVLEASGNDKDQAIDSLLSMSDPDYVPAQTQSTGGGAPHQGREPTQTELDEEFARRLMLEEEQQAQGGSWPPREQTYSHSNNVPYQTYQSRRSGEHQRPSGGQGGGIGDMANDLQQQFRSFIGGARGTGTQSQPQTQGGSGAGYQDQFNKFADTGKKTFNSIFNKVKQKMEEFDGRHPPDTQNMNQPAQSGHWSNWQGPNVVQNPQQQTVYVQPPAPPHSVFTAQSPPPASSHGALNSNPYGTSSTNAQPDTNAALPASSGRWHYEPEPAPAAPAQLQAPATGTGATEEPRRSIDTSRLGLLPKRPVSLMDVNANTRAPAPAPAPAASHTAELDSDEESLEYVDRPVPGGMSRP
ncbi:CUE domain protein [Ceratobasidium sp. AG-Ba]|nr:CUE domain protein [Ceratobasidium sp. AG-Ba]